MPTQKELQAFVERRHPEYDDMAAHWDFVELTYKGGREWFDPEPLAADQFFKRGNIFRYMKEGDAEYEARIKRAYRFNHTREVVDLVQKYIFKASVTRSEDAPSLVKDFWDNATLSGLDINQFAKTVSSKSSIFGKPWIVVDSNATAEAVSTADAKSTGVRVYAYVVRPQDVLDLGYDELGTLTWILIREFIRDDQNPILSSGDVTERYRLWTQTGWQLYEWQTIGKKQQVVLVAEGEHKLGEVPAFAVDHVVNDSRYSSPGLVSDIAYLDRAVANYLSNLDAIIQDQTFSQLAMPAQALMPGDEAYDKLVEMGTKRIFIYDGEGGAKPEYLSPDVKQASLIIMVINKIINEIYHTIGMAGERTKQDNAAGIDNSSGVAKAYDFERMNSLLTSKADALENFENRLIDLVLKWHGQDAPAEELVKYPDTFDVRGLFDEFTVADNLTVIEAPDLVRREQMRQVIDKLFPRLTEDLRKKMDVELESWPKDPVEEAVKMAAAKASTLPHAPVFVKKQAATNPQTANRQGQVTSATP